MADTMLEASEAPRRVFERIVLRRGSLRGLGQRCGRSTMWIWRQLRQNKGVDLVKTGKVLDQLGVPIRFFYEEILDESPAYDPAWLLEHYREGNGIPRDPFLAEVHDRLLNLLDQPGASRGRRRRHEVEQLEELGFFDRGAAKTGLETLGKELLVEASSHPSFGNMADSAHVLLVWAAIQRARGHRDDSVDAYGLAYRLAVASGDSKLVGFFFYLAGHLLTELGQPGHGLRFAERSCSIFQRFRDRDLVARALVLNGIALYDLRRFHEARTCVVAALRLAPRHRWRTRSAAWIQLGNLAIKRGQYRKALARMERAKKLTRTPSYLQAFVLWREAAVLGRLGRPADAVDAFQGAIKLFEDFGQPLDVAFVAVDLVEMLMANGRVSETLGMVRAMTPCFERLGSNAQALSLWLDILALILQGSRSSSLDQLAQLRSSLRTADPKIRLQLNS